MEINMKYVMTEAVCAQGMELLNKEAVYVAHDANPANYKEEMAEADALIVRAAPAGIVSREVMENAPNLKVIGRTGVGYDSVDVEAAAALGIPVIITPGANNRAVAEHSLTMMLALSKNLVEAQVETAKGNWKIRDAHKQFELYGKKAGIIGLGRIGRDVASLCAAIGMTVVGYDPFLTCEQMEGMGYEYYGDYEALLKDCDVISIHVPLTEQTENMIGKKQFAKMKKTAIIINCSRGGIINEADLIEALNSGEIAGAGLDVFMGEELHPGNPLLGAKNLVISPHSAAQTREAVINMATMCVEGCKAVCAGKKWKFVANPSVYDHEKWKNAEWA